MWYYLRTSCPTPWTRSTIIPNTAQSCPNQNPSSHTRSTKPAHACMHSLAWFNGTKRRTRIYRTIGTEGPPGTGALSRSGFLNILGRRGLQFVPKSALRRNFYSSVLNRTYLCKNSRQFLMFEKPGSANFVRIKEENLEFATSTLGPRLCLGNRTNSGLNA